MAKIKRKKKMTLLELVEWAWNNPEQVESKVFQSDRMGTLGECSEVHFSTDGHGFYTKVVTDKDIFTVEITEKVTEDTEFDCLVELNDIEGFEIYENDSIRELIDGTSRAFYILNEDKTMTLIWKDGELVE
ncbi:TPA: hypothetical protein O5M74_001594 [Staphylococcus aureus]|nr:hypothetical protein [Staphylococcus aureus]HCY7680100.1 hypothetical protein [Staphylococcus aureus]HCZ9808584.1 hypothetical protein [Staphylococcus aureus]HDA0419426.1 hypothetical protein [Staphylococcus aureus]HDA6210914.1 hypothetical protein [Staphylococcus aureus]